MARTNAQTLPREQIYWSWQINGVVSLQLLVYNLLRTADSSLTQSRILRKWIINTRGYASIIPSPGDIVYGFIFELTPKDERSLDGFEGWSYKKLYIPITKGPQEMVTALVYVDVERTEIGESKKEYVHRLNNAIVDGLKEGIPKGYVDRYIRPFIPAEPADCIGT